MVVPRGAQARAMLQAGPPASFPPAAGDTVDDRFAEPNRLLDALDPKRDRARTKPIPSFVARRIREGRPRTFPCKTQRVAAAGPCLYAGSIDIPPDPLSRLERCRVGR